MKHSDTKPCNKGLICEYEKPFMGMGVHLMERHLQCTGHCKGEWEIQYRYDESDELENPTDGWWNMVHNHSGRYHFSFEEAFYFWKKYSEQRQHERVANWRFFNAKTKEAIPCEIFE